MAMMDGGPAVITRPPELLTPDDALRRARVVLISEGVRPREGLWRETRRWTESASKSMMVLPWMVVERYLRLLRDRAQEKLREG